MSNGISLGVMASHGGSNLQAILDACSDGRLNGNVCVVISNNSRSRSLQRARQAGVPALHLSSVTHPDPERLATAILVSLRKYEVDIVILAGYMRKVGTTILKAFPSRVLNSHPALLPNYGGRGMYGDRVHSAVLEAGDDESGISIHLADDVYDHGRLVAQVKIEVKPSDDLNALRKRIQIREHSFWVETLQKISTGEINLDESPLERLA